MLHVLKQYWHLFSCQGGVSFLKGHMFYILASWLRVSLPKTPPMYWKLDAIIAYNSHYKQGWNSDPSAWQFYPFQILQWDLWVLVNQLMKFTVKAGMIQTATELALSFLQRTCGIVCIPVVTAYQTPSITTYSNWKSFWQNRIVCKPSGKGVGGALVESASLNLQNYIFFFKECLKQFSESFVNVAQFINIS